MSTLKFVGQVIVIPLVIGTILALFIVSAFSQDGNAVRNPEPVVQYTDSRVESCMDDLGLDAPLFSQPLPSNAVELVGAVRLNDCKDAFLAEWDARS